MKAHRAIARRAFLDARVRTIAFAYLFAGISYASVSGYRSAYSTLGERLAFVHSFAGNDAVRLFYGKPYDLLTVGGFAAWRVGGMLSIFAGAWGLLAAVRALRAEEDAGRAEIVLAGAVGRRGAYVAALAAIGAGVAILWLGGFLGLVLGGLDVGGSAYLALAMVAVVPVFVGVGALTSQLAPTRRVATELASGVLVLAFILRTVADTSDSVQWLRWATPLGWVEELRAYTGAQPLVLLVLFGVSAALVVLSGALALRRDIGAGLLPAHDRAPARLGLLSSPTLQALRGERSSLLVWLLGSGAFAFVVGAISTSISSAGVSPAMLRELRKMGAVSITTPGGYIGFCFLFFVLALSLFACSQLAAARAAESEEQLEILLALPVARRGWLGGRLALAIFAAAAIALFTGACAWAGAASQNAGVSLPDMIAAGANTLPVALLFLGFGALVFAVAPRASSAVNYGLVVLAFVWQLFGGLLEAPHWMLDLTPFQHIGLVPAQPFRAGAAVVMLAIALVAMLAASAIFRRRDLAGG